MSDCAPAVCLASGGDRHQGSTVMSELDIHEVVSLYRFEATLERLTVAIKQAGLIIFSRIDHQSGAREAGLEVPPTTVLTYGHPKGGTQIMLAAPLAALDLPLRVLVRVREDGQTVIGVSMPMNELSRAAGLRQQARLAEGEKPPAPRTALALAKSKTYPVGRRRAGAPARLQGRFRQLQRLVRAARFPAIAGRTGNGRRISRRRWPAIYAADAATAGGHDRSRTPDGQATA
jgi:uncharacterized protein (DUF302 family)